MLANILIVIGCVLAALAFLFLVTSTSATHSRKESNDFTGAVVAVIGTTYAVLLAFMLSGVWNMFQQAQINEEQEANSLVNVFRLAEHLKYSNGAEIQGLCRTYAEQAVNHEWPSLAKDQRLQDGSNLIYQLWRAAGQSKVHNDTDSIVIYQLMEELREMTEFRRIRLTQAREKLPGILWAVLIVGGIITVTACCFFGVPNFRFHILQVVVLAFLISLVLVAIQDIDRPYQGVVKVAPEGFQAALQTFQNETGR
jgi:hypothetical protein